MSEPRRHRALIVDDERLARVVVRAMLADHPQFELVGEASDGTRAAAMIRSVSPDLIFLDIEMPMRDGFRLLADLAPRERPAVVFVTAHRQYALAAFGVSAVDYLLKPFSRQRFATAIDRVLRFLRGAESPPPAPRAQRLAVRDGDRLVFVEPGDVHCFEVCGNYVRVTVEAQSMWLRTSLSTLVGRLDAGSFLRISRSMLVNLRHVRVMRPRSNGQCELVLGNGAIVRSSRRYTQQVRAALGRSSRVNQD